MMTALLTAAMLCSMALPVSAADFYYWGSLTSEQAEAFNQMELLDDQGMFAWIGPGEGYGNGAYQVYSEHVAKQIPIYENGEDTGKTREFEGDTIYTVFPQMNLLWFNWKEGTDSAQAAEQAETILRKYYPDLQFAMQLAPFAGKSAQYARADDEGINLRDNAASQGNPETAMAIMHDLAAADLISAFYSWGSEVRYHMIGYGAYSADTRLHYSSGIDKEQAAAIQEWLTANGYDYTFQWDSVTDKYGEITEEGYYLTPNHPTSFRDTVLTAAVIYKQFQHNPEFYILESATPTIYNAFNALTLCGDTNVDGSLTVSDAVLLARITAEDSTLTAIPAGLENADFNRDGSTDADDLTGLLKALAGL